MPQCERECNRSGQNLPCSFPTWIPIMLPTHPCMEYKYNSCQCHLKFSDEVFPYLVFILFQKCLIKHFCMFWNKPNNWIWNTWEGNKVWYYKRQQTSEESWRAYQLKHSDKKKKKFKKEIWITWDTITTLSMTFSWNTHYIFKKRFLNEKNVFKIFFSNISCLKKKITEGLDNYQPSTIKILIKENVPIGRKITLHPCQYVYFFL